jgi:DNA gyrase/topoisomerase IV subunit B
MINAIVRALFLYHLAEYQSGSATTVKVELHNPVFRISDDGRGHAIHRMINGLPYLVLVYSQLEYPFGLVTDTPIQLHTIGMSLINSLCSELTVTVYKTQGIYIRYYKHGQLDTEESRENEENVTGTTVEGKVNPALFVGAGDQKDLEQWLKEIKSVHQQLKILYNGKEL